MDESIQKSAVMFVDKVNKKALALKAADNFFVKMLKRLAPEIIQSQKSKVVNDAVQAIIENDKKIMLHKKEQ